MIVYCKEPGCVRFIPARAGNTSYRRERDGIEAIPGRSFTGAWIETPTHNRYHVALIVAPSRERGLKHLPPRTPNG